MSSKDYYASLWDTAEELNRNDCFNDLAYRNMTFDRDDRPEHLLSKAARAYAENFQPALEQHGIMFTGNVGPGKTFYACCDRPRLYRVGDDAPAACKGALQLRSCGENTRENTQS